MPGPAHALTPPSSLVCHACVQGKGSKRAISSLMVNAPATELTQLPSGLRVASEVRAWMLVFICVCACVYVCTYMPAVGP